MKQSIARFKTEKINKIKKLKNAKPKEFWKIINSVNKRERSTAPLDDLHAYFREINDQTYDDENIENNNSDENADRLNEELNQSITENEIINAIKQLKNNKSCGPDEILNEHLKHTSQLMLPIYSNLFNLIFDTGIVPQNWT